MRNPTKLMKAILTDETAQKLIDYVSPIYGNSYVGLWIFQAIGAVLSDVCQIADQLRYETSPTTAEILLDYWEAQYGLPKDPSLTTEQRRARIIMKKQSRGPCNPARLCAAISAALGGVEVEITENVEPNTFLVNIREVVPSIVPAVAVIERMKPAHLIYQIRVATQTIAEADIKVAVAVTHAEKYKVEILQTTDKQFAVFYDNNGEVRLELPTGSTVAYDGNGTVTIDGLNEAVTHENGTVTIGG